jgi:predicted  nucleic acid-binding Zn-ribbon protein
MAETLNQRVTRLENLMGSLAEKQNRLDDVLVTLAEAQIATEHRFQQTAESLRELREGLAELKTELKEQARQTDERIANLVVAIGELTRRMPLP